MKTILVNQSTAAKRRVSVLFRDAVTGLPKANVANPTIKLKLDGGAIFTGAGAWYKLSDTDLPGQWDYELTASEVAAIGTYRGNAKGDGTEDYPLLFQVANTDPENLFSVSYWSMAHDTVVDSILDQDVLLTPTFMDVMSAANVNVTLVNPVIQSSTITLAAGDDYSATDGRSLQWSTENASTWPDLSEAAIAFTATKQTDKSGTNTITKAGVVLNPSGANKQVQVELTATDTAGMATGAHAYTYTLKATLFNGHVVTLQTGTVTIK